MSAIYQIYIPLSPPHHVFKKYLSHNGFVLFARHMKTLMFSVKFVFDSIPCPFWTKSAILKTNKSFWSMFFDREYISLWFATGQWIDDSLFFKTFKVIAPLKILNIVDSHGLYAIIIVACAMFTVLGHIVFMLYEHNCLKLIRWCACRVRATDC